VQNECRSMNILNIQLYKDIIDTFYDCSYEFKRIYAEL
jgi:hypothetical protein